MSFSGRALSAAFLGNSSPPSWAALGLSPRYKATQGTGQVPWKEPETAEEGAEEGACTACWVSEGTGHQGPEARREDGFASCILLFSLVYPIIVELLGTQTLLHIEGLSHHPFKELWKPHYVLVSTED